MPFISSKNALAADDCRMVVGSLQIANIAVVVASVEKEPQV